MLKGFKMKLYPGMEAEYERRHKLLWPEMKDMIHEHGGKNYSIFLDRDTLTLFGYIEIEDEAHHLRLDARVHVHHLGDDPFLVGRAEGDDNEDLVVRVVLGDGVVRDLHVDLVLDVVCHNNNVFRCPLTASGVAISFLLIIKPCVINANPSTLSSHETFL